MEQLPQRLLHQCFVLPRGQVQDPQILPIGIRRLVGPQGVVGHAEVARREQLLAVTGAGKGARLTHQPVDDVPVVDAMLVTPPQARQTLDQLLGVPHLQVLDEQAHLDLLADQPAGHRVAVAIDGNQAATIHAGPHPLARFQAPGRQRPQPHALLGQAFPTAGIELRQHLLQERRVVLTAGEVAAATQHQRLIDGRLETPMPLLGVAVLVRMVRLDLLPGQAVVVQQRLVTPRELLPLREVVDRRAHPIRAMALGDAAQLDQGVLQSFAQGLEALREADRHRLPVRVGQHEMVDQVVERLPLDADSQLVHRGEIGGAQPAGFVDLAEEHFLGRTAARTPAADVSLQGPQLAVGEAAGMAALQFLEDRLGLKPGVDVEEFAHGGPDLLEGIGPGVPGVG